MLRVVKDGNGRIGLFRYDMYGNVKSGKDG